MSFYTFEISDMPPYSDNVFLKVVLDFVCLLTVGLPILILYLVGKPYERGFYCDDESIRYPFHESTITNNVLYSVGICLPTILIVVVEVLHYVSGDSAIGGAFQKKFLKWDVHPLAWDLYLKLGVFAFGACLSQLTTDIAKYSIGRLRPHFIDLCNPNVNCNDPQNKFKYFVNFKCNGKDGYDSPFNVKESRLSFPSGHSSFSAYVMVYIVLYLQVRMTCRGNNLLRPCLQALALWATYYTALSRISDYKHHWSDVLCGSIIGIVVALLVVFFISDLFVSSRNQNSSGGRYVENSQFVETIANQPPQNS